MPTSQPPEENDRPNQRGRRRHADQRRYPRDPGQRLQKYYNYYSGTLQPELVIATEPVVPGAENGSGVAATTIDCFDRCGWRHP